MGEYIKYSPLGLFLKGKFYFMKIKEYLKETRAEFKHVNWPTRKQAIMYTIIVIIISVFIAYFLGLFDFIFSKILGKILNF